MDSNANLNDPTRFDEKQVSGIIYAPQEDMAIEIRGDRPPTPPSIGPQFETGVIRRPHDSSAMPPCVAPQFVTSVGGNSHTAIVRRLPQVPSTSSLREGFEGLPLGKELVDPGVTSDSPPPDADPVIADVPDNNASNFGKKITNRLSIYPTRAEESPPPKGALPNAAPGGLATISLDEAFHNKNSECCPDFRAKCTIL